MEWPWVCLLVSLEEREEEEKGEEDEGEEEEGKAKKPLASEAYVKRGFGIGFVCQEGRAQANKPSHDFWAPFGYCSMSSRSKVSSLLALLLLWMYFKLSEHWYSVPVWTYCLRGSLGSSVLPHKARSLQAGSLCNPEV